MPGGMDGQVRVEGLFRDKISSKLKSIQNKAVGLGSKLMTVGSRIRSAGQSMTIGLTTPIVAAGFAIVKTSLKFGDSMAQITALSEASADQVARWREEILKLAPEVAKSPQELAEAMLFLASAGLKAGTEMEVLEIAARASATGLGETKEIAKTLTNVLNAYGQENIDSARTAGILIEAVKQGTVEVDEMGEVIGRALPLASELGISFEELAAAQAALSLINADASENMTSFMGIMRGLILPSDRAKELLAGMGKTFGDLREELKTKGLIATLQDLREGLDIEEIATLFPKVRGLTGLLNLTGKEAEKVDAIFKNVASAGVTDLDQAFEDIQTPGFQFRKAMAQLQVIMIMLGDVIVPMLVKALPPLIKFIARGAEVFGNLPGPVQKAIVIFFALLAALGPVLIIVGSLIGAVGAIATAFGVTIGTILLFASGIGLVIAAIVLIVIAIFFLVKNWDSIKGVLIDIGMAIADFFTKTLPGKFNEFKDKVVGIFGGFASAVRDKVVAGFNAVRDFVVEWATTIGGAVAGVVMSVVEALTGFGSAVIEGIANGLSAAIAFVMKWGGKFIEVFSEQFANSIAQVRMFGDNFVKTFMFWFRIASTVVMFYFNVYKSIFMFAFRVISKVAEVALQVIVAIFNWGFNLAVVTIQFYLDLIVARIKFFWAVGTALFTFAFGVVSAIISAAFGIYVALFSGAFDVILAVVKLAWSVIVLAFKLAFLVISTAMGVWWAIVSQQVKSGMKIIWEVIKFVWALIKGVFVIVFAVIVGILTTFLALIRGDWSAAWEAIKLMVSTIWTEIKSIIGAAISLLKVVLFEAWTSIKTFTAEIWGGVKDVILGALEAIKSEGTTIINGFIGVIESGLNAVIKGINGFTEGINKLAGAIGLDKIGIGDIPSIGEVKLPRLDIGGDIIKTGLAIVHKGERVLTADTVKSEQTRQRGGDIHLTLEFHAPVTAEDGAAIGETVKDVLRQHVLRFGGAS